MSEFVNHFAETIFIQKYKHEGAGTWQELCTTLVEEVCGKQMSKTSKKQLIQFMTDMKFIPGGRYLYYAGRGIRFYNNCGSYDTKVLTRDGWRRMGCVGEAEVLSPVDGRYYPAKFVSRGVQKLNKVSFKIAGHKTNLVISARFTANHHWPLADGRDTYALQVGDIVPANTHVAGRSELGFLHGFMFGDGSVSGQLRLCGRKAAYLDRLAKFGTCSYPDFANGDPVLYFDKDISWKSLPNGAQADYIASFLEGWLAADGSINNNEISSVHKEHLMWFKKYAAFAGLTIPRCIRTVVRDVKIGKYEYKNHKLYLLAFIKSPAAFKVVSIEPDGEEEVFCPYEPVHNRIIIDNNIDTFNCFLLRAESDTREDWADLSWKAERCLMTGGGIGTDYSVYREAGRKLARTGGTASGPLPKIEMINSIGSRVMQGGSRRSALYASLNWQHGDILKFIRSKDWHNMPIPGTNLTYWDIKQLDFNFPAPLDMTNISVNYDDKWLKELDSSSTFMLNVRQALKTGEPGFSFNFGHKQRETLRNACTEVCSSDDSDVCNLGSLNLAKIESLSELIDVTRLAIEFLLLGSLRAELPYAKIYKVRKKNRRLGLGLMGVHEWLIQRGYRYEVVPELHAWLAVYAEISHKAARSKAERLGITRPVATRAIAPTGTIGILAGTTTGIEPLFAVAYKRRYLKGTVWHYQHVIDAAAANLIDRYGANPDNIESALDLAIDYERRIKFQYDVQRYVDMSISSTINLPAYGSEHNNEDTVKPFAKTLAKYAHGLRGFTCYPDGARGGQPLSRVAYKDAIRDQGIEYKEHDICIISGKGGTCGV